MNNVKIEATDQNIMITVDRRLLDIDVLTEFLDKLRIEYLAKKINFSEEILDLAEEIRKDGWNAIKEQFLKKINNESCN